MYVYMYVKTCHLLYFNIFNFNFLQFFAFSLNYFKDDDNFFNIIFNLVALYDNDDDFDFLFVHIYIINNIYSLY